MPSLIVLVSFISPFRSERRMARELVGTDEFIEVFVDTGAGSPACSAIPKVFMKRPKAGNNREVTGIAHRPYRAPEAAGAELIHSYGAGRGPDVHARRVVAWLPRSAATSKVQTRNSPYTSRINLECPRRLAWWAPNPRSRRLASDIGRTSKARRPLYRRQLDLGFALQTPVRSGDEVVSFSGFVVARL